MDQATLTAYDQARNFSNKGVRSLCYAPYTTLYFDVRGDVRVCCHNWAHPAGNILKNSIDEIWQGLRIKILREALKNYQFGPGCDFCKFQTAETFANTAMRYYDAFAVPDEAPLWPQQLQFSISNSCNLECIMCRGSWSSAIRARREKLPPLPRLYSDAFFESLWKYLPHVKQLKFLGGEPFLITEYYKLWDQMIADDLAAPCHVTTNGTQYNSRVERVLEHLPMSFSVSMDGATKATLESIRVNAKYEEVMANARRFRDYARARKTTFTLTYCLMRQNWHEFGDYCLLADSWDCPVALNTVVQPPEFGIYTLPAVELRKILTAMEAQAPRLESALKKNRATWFGELGRIRAKCNQN
ncbi:MAG TPA: radical SAM protein [Opitutaceae bacterium]|jgi:MoaA/NifB/PqqE/SkfB family radical SAM enzyme|nr:radical SAM protein [Opitutaceae bacterium]